MKQRVALIKQRLEKAFQPSYLEVIDDSEKHKGHAGSQGGAGHYTIKIKATCFEHENRVNIHRKIYAELNDLIPHKIHALQIKVMSE